MHWLHRLTTLARVVDLRYRSNRAILFVTLVVAAAGWIGFGALDGGFADALALGGASFLAWAIGRELDPDEPASALVAALGATGVVILLGASELWVLAGILVIARLLLRSVGPPPTLLDLAALLGLGVVLGTRPGGWPVGLVLAFAIARDRTLPGDPARLSRLTALLVASASTGVAIASGVGAWRTPSVGEWALAGLGIVAGMLIRPVQPLSPTDVGGLVLIGRRLASARRVTLVALMAVVLLAGGSGIVAAGGAYASVVAVAAVQWRLVPVGGGDRVAVPDGRE